MDQRPVLGSRDRRLPGAKMIFLAGVGAEDEGATAGSGIGKSKFTGV